MPRVFLTPFVLVGLLFLTSCSSSQEPKPDKLEQAKSKCDEAKETNKSYSEVLSKITQGDRGYRLTFLMQQYHMLETKECFTAAQIASAKALIDIITNKLEP